MTSPTDLAHTWGQDIKIDASGDLFLAAGAELARQRVIRRLLTTPGDYIWSLGYGAGLSRIVGTPIDIRAIEAMVRLQMRYERSVRQSPPPTVTRNNPKELDPNTLSLSIRYIEAGMNNLSAFDLDVMR